MTTPASTRPTPFGYGTSDHTIIELIATALATGASVAAMATSLLAFLYALGLGMTAIRLALTLARTVPIPAVSSSMGPAVSATTRGEAAFRAVYVLAAARRLQAAINRNDLRSGLETERRYLAQHRAAEANRQRAAALVDQVAASQPDIPLEWVSVLDAKTSPECRAADGGIFYADAPPAIGYPGTVHPSCRCRCRQADHEHGMTVDELTAGRAMAHH